jgi:hypothetical protein
LVRVDIIDKKVIEILDPYMGEVGGLSSGEGSARPFTMMSASSASKFGVPTSELSARRERTNQFYRERNLHTKGTVDSYEDTVKKIYQDTLKYRDTPATQLYGPDVESYVAGQDEIGSTTTSDWIGYETEKPWW